MYKVQIMSLLQRLPYKEYEYILKLSAEQCAVIAKLADINISFNEQTRPGEVLVKYLDRRGFSLSQFRQFVTLALHEKSVYQPQSKDNEKSVYQPQLKVAILIANERYNHLSKLATPSIDCDSLGGNLRSLGFITVTIKNTNSSDLKDILVRTIEAIPENSYCLIFYAGHGCELCNAKCLLGIETPLENIEFSHCVTENWLLREVAKCKPELCVLIMDMCRISLDRATNPKIYMEISDLESYSIHNDLIISYSTQSAHSAYEVLQIECSTTIDNCVTYELKTGDTDRIVPGASQYVTALCNRLTENTDISALLDKVHGDVENSIKKQTPIKVQCGVSKRSLYDPSKGDSKELRTKLSEILEIYKENCAVL